MILSENLDARADPMGPRRGGYRMYSSTLYTHIYIRVNHCTIIKKHPYDGVYVYAGLTEDDDTLQWQSACVTIYLSAAHNIVYNIICHCHTAPRHEDNVEKNQGLLYTSPPRVVLNVLYAPCVLRTRVHPLHFFPLLYRYLLYCAVSYRCTTCPCTRRKSRDVFVIQ